MPREAPETLFSARDLAIILIAVGAEMTPQADELVPQEVWEAVFADDLAATGIPLHGEPYHFLTPAGFEVLARLTEAAKV